MGLDDNLRTAFADRVIVAPVGPICIRALTEEGILPHVVPEHPKMGPLVLAVAEYFAKLDINTTKPLPKIDSNDYGKRT
jgi:uroporphyrinogen-III synthase